MSTNPRARAWIEIRAAALTANYERIRAQVGPGAGVLPMVKAEAYGLGALEVVRRLEPRAPWGYGVATAEEGLRLRAAGVRRPVVVFSPAPTGSLEAGVRAGLVFSVGSRRAAREIAECSERTGRVTELHLEVDTGMGRSGVDWRRGREWLERFQRALGSGARWSGLYTHLHSAETDPASVRTQLDRFAGWAERVPAGARVVCHALNSAGVFRSPERALDLVRPGIFLYGGACGPGAPAPEPVIRLRARVVDVREVPPGTTVGYGATYRARSRERWATLAIGYGDGLPRALGGCGHALVSGRRVPIVGRISMDVTVVNITGLGGVGVGDIATLIGDDGLARITLDEVAGRAGTISYEVLTGLTGRVPRVWDDVDDG